MSFQITLSSRSRMAGRFISAVHRELQRAFSQSGMTQQELATKLDVNRATINKRLMGEENLTLRSIADLGWAMGLQPSFAFKAPARAEGQNDVPEHLAAAAGRGPQTALSTASAKALIAGAVTADA